ncbi:conserved Plasmodium protein, unknown function [Plasmodium gallinaceum]|uniref:Tetratricopeptide repeat family protein n=1 Tax=Plasmodium gallinaceum TaxID=5849 RepID=A0A1J1GVA2_PLAGA|nr:conserved Plasmodium protein, unknown function [Plasmodium gallinaceum]CRG96220.1 conserved Plasmodium protein, unknown function [Plasmodium gallinaceum]
MNENLNKEKIKKKKKKYNDYAIDKKKLEYLSFVCEEEDINLFCNFNEKCQSNNEQTDNNNNLYDFTDNLKFNSFKCNDFENSYLTVLVQNENIENDKKSCFSISYIYKHFLYYCDFFYNDYKKHRSTNFIKNFEKDIYFFNLINEKRNLINKNKRTLNEINTKENEKQKINRNHEIAINYKEKFYSNINNEIRNHINDDSNIIISTYIAYTKLQNELFEFYIPKLNYNKIICFDKHLKSGINNIYDCNISKDYINENHNIMNNSIVEVLPKKNNKKIEKYDNICIKKKDSKLKKEKINLKKKRKKKNSFTYFSNFSYPLYNYTSSEESVMSFSKFLHTSKNSKKKNINEFITGEKGENDSMIIFNEIVNLCKKNKIFTFKKNIKENKSLIIENCKKKLFNQKLDIFEEIYHNNKNKICEKICEKFCEKSNDRNLSCSRINTNYHDSEYIYMTPSNKCDKDILLSFHKKHNFNLCSIYRKNENKQSEGENKIIKSFINDNCIEKISNQEIKHLEENKDMKKEVIEEKGIKLKDKNNYSFLNFMNLKKTRENNLLKIQILKGLNQTNYDPLYLENIVNNKNNINEEKLKKEKKICDIKHLYMNKESNVINEIFQLSVLKNFYVLKYKFSSLYINEKYDIIIQLYKNEYIYFDFYLTIIFIKSLIKLKKYYDCLKYIFEINGKNLQIFNRSILYYFCGLCYDKMNKLKLSTKEYSKAIVHQLNNNKNKKIFNKLEKECKKNEIEILPFIFICLDKLIGNYRLKSQEEEILLKYVRIHYDLNKHIYFYLSKINNKKKYNINELLNTKNEITFNNINVSNNHKSFIKMEDVIPLYFITNNNMNVQEKDKEYFININTKNNKNEKKKNSKIYDNTCDDKKRIIDVEKNSSFFNYNKDKFYVENLYKRENFYNLLYKNKEESFLLNEKNSKSNLKKKNDSSYNKYININNLLSVVNKKSDIDHKECFCSEYSVDDKINNNNDKNIKKKIIYLFDKIIKNESKNYKLFNCDDFFFSILNIFFNLHCNKIFNKIGKFIRANFANQNVLNSVRKLGLNLKLIDIHFADDSNKVKIDELISNKICMKNKIVNKKYNTLEKDEKNMLSEQKNNTKIYIDKLISIDFICINLYCFKNYDYLNSYYISKYIIRIKKEYDNKNAIILFISSLVNLNDTFKNKKNKIREMLLLYNERVSKIRNKNKTYYFNPDFYTYKNDFLDYYIFGIISFLKNNLKKAYFFFIKSINLRKEFYLSYIFLFQICLINNISDKKLVFYQCLKLNPYNILPYLIYSSRLIKMFQNNKINVNNYSINYLKDILSKGVDLDKENIFIYNELFVYYFIIKDFSQCEIIIKKIFLTYDIFSSNISPISSILYNVAMYYVYQKNLHKAEKYLIKILYTNPFEIKSLYLLTYILYMQKNKYWICFFDYSIYLENILLSKKIISCKTFFCEYFFKKLKELKELSLFITYYKIMKKIKKFYSFLKNYIDKNYFSFIVDINKVNNIS